MCLFFLLQFKVEIWIEDKSIDALIEFGKTLKGLGI